MLGSLIKTSKILEKKSVIKAIKDSFEGKVQELNLKCFEEGFKQVKWK